MSGSDSRAKSGSVEAFKESWRARPEANYNHWVKGPARNQIQLAFRSHWEVFSQLVGDGPPGALLEVGCGRGSLSSYFAENGWHVTLLDSSAEVIEIARSIFVANGHDATFVVGDALELPFEDGQFDVVASIGLLEHFENPKAALDEQWRMLRPGGWMLCYIVPERPDNLQRYFNWINWLLKNSIGRWVERKSRRAKPEVYRSDAGSERYLPIVESYHPLTVVVTGMYSLPMISHSPAFPFSLLPAPMERGLVAIFGAVLRARRFLNGKHGWLCDERYGQAFLVAAQRK